MITQRNSKSTLEEGSFKIRILPEIAGIEVVGADVSSDPSGEQHVLLHDGHPFGVQGHEIGVLHELDDEGLGGLLNGDESLTLPAAVWSDVQGDLPDEPLEWQPGDEHFRGFLEPADLPKGDSPRTESAFSLDRLRVGVLFLGRVDRARLIRCLEFAVAPGFELLGLGLLLWSATSTFLDVLGLFLGTASFLALFVDLSFGSSHW